MFGKPKKTQSYFLNGSAIALRPYPPYVSLFQQIKKKVPKTVFFLNGKAPPLNVTAIKKITFSFLRLPVPKRNKKSLFISSYFSFLKLLLILAYIILGKTHIKKSGFFSGRTTKRGGG